MMDKNHWIFILNLRQQQLDNEVFLTKSIKFKSASECLWGADSRD